MRYILGSGLVAMLAKAILPGLWTIVPHNKSRFYSNDLSIDNYLIYNDKMAPMLNDLGFLRSHTIYNYNSAWSLDGQIIREFSSDLAEIWSYKIFGLDPPGHFVNTLRTRMSLEVFDCRLSSLYDSLYDKYHSTFASFKVSDVEALTSAAIELKGQVIQHEGVISTYPIYDCPDSMDLSVITGHSSMLDFEGLNQLWVVDPSIPFFKVVNIRNDGLYNFMFVSQCDDPIRSIRAAVPDFRPIAYKIIKNAIPTGEIVKGSHNITPIGATAENDYAVDISTVIMKLLNYTNSK